MLTRKSLVLLAGLLIIAALMILVSWNPATVSAQGPAATPQPPAAVLKVVEVPAYASEPNAITATVKYVTDTVVGERSAAVAMGTTGLSNVPINVPVRLKVSAADPKNSGKPTWTIVNKPTDSKATFKDPSAMATEFTPDVVGAYQVSVTLKNDAGLTSTAVFAFFDAGTFVGLEKGNCKTCHPVQTAEWAKTGHSEVFSKSLDNQIFGPGRAGMYAETCLTCHTVGYYVPPIGVGAGGFYEARAKANWALPTFKQQDAAFAKTAPSNLESAPAEVKNMGNIQCEQCHGPASEHVKSGAKVMATSMSNGACNACHAAGSSHVKGKEIKNSKHTTGESFETINGPARQACVRCHSAEAFVTFLKNPKNQAAWSNEEGAVGCATCHDPHSEANAFQLRVVGKPVEVPFATKDVGLSATCYTCHWSRRDIKADTATIKANGTPGYSHYSSAAELLSDLGGYTYDQTLPNSPHGLMVGAVPMPNPAYDAVKNPNVKQFLYSKTGDAKGNTPGPCIVCHMAASFRDAKDPNYLKVGDHSFNTTPDGKFDYGESCKPCHGEVKDFNLKAKADYDGNGKVEGVQDEVKGLLMAVWKGLEAKGWKQSDHTPYGTAPANADAKQKAAFYNFRMLYGVMWAADASGNISGGNEGKAAAIHNFKRSVALLQLAIKDLTGALPGGMTEMK